MFNEKNPIWIKIYKILVIVSAVAILIAGFIWAIEESTRYGYYSHSSHIDFEDFLMYFAIAAAIAALDYVSGMLVANFLSNVQTIREKLEEK